MWQKPKNLFARLKSFRQRQVRERIYIVPSLAGFAFALFTLTSYILSFLDGNAGLASLAFSGFALLMVSIWLTHRNLSNLGLDDEGGLQNFGQDDKAGIRVNGQGLPALPAGSRLSLPGLAARKRNRFSTTYPSGLAYAWNFRRSVLKNVEDWGERPRFEPHSPWARVDWRRWARTKKFELRPATEPAPAPTLRRFAAARTGVPDASAWAWGWSLAVLLVMAAAGFRYAPQGIILGLWVWLGVLLPSFFVRRKLRYAGFANFFFAWAAFIVLLVFAKNDLPDEAVSLATAALLLTPFALHIEVGGQQDLRKTVKSFAPPLILFLVVLYSLQAFWPKNLRVWGNDFFDPANSELNWGNSSDAEPRGFHLADRFFPSGRWLYRLPLSTQLSDAPSTPPAESKRDTADYRGQPAYWRERTYERSRGGLDWFFAVQPRDLGTRTEFTRMRGSSASISSTKPVVFWRAPPYRAVPATPSATDAPREFNMTSKGASPRVAELVNTLRLSPDRAAQSADEVVRWMAGQNFRYSLSPGRVDSLDAFLFQKKVGLCQHYAGALAYLLRTAKIPARVVTGYHGGELSPWGDALMLRDTDAHAWVEVWEPAQRSWVLVDPTFALFPAQPTSSRPDWLNELSWWGLRLQGELARWLGLLPERWILFVMAGFSVLAFGGRAARRSLSRRRRPLDDDPILSARVREWEKKVAGIDGRARHDDEGLQTYFTRVVGKTAVGAKHAALSAELDALVGILYAHHSR